MALRRTQRLQTKQQPKQNFFVNLPPVLWRHTLLFLLQINLLTYNDENIDGTEIKHLYHTLQLVTKSWNIDLFRELFVFELYDERLMTSTVHDIYCKKNRKCDVGGILTKDTLFARPIFISLYDCCLQSLVHLKQLVLTDCSARDFSLLNKLTFLKLQIRYFEEKVTLPLSLVELHIEISLTHRIFREQVLCIPPKVKCFSFSAYDNDFEYYDECESWDFLQFNENITSLSLHVPHLSGLDIKPLQNLHDLNLRKCCFLDVKEISYFGTLPNLRCLTLPHGLCNVDFMLETLGNSFAQVEELCLPAEPNNKEWQRNWPHLCKIFIVSE